MYDNLIYGNGLTIALIYMMENMLVKNEYKKLLHLNSFVEYFINAPEHKKISREFRKTFNKDTEKYLKMHVKNKIYILKDLDEINRIGFERWVSKKVLLDDSEEFKNIKEYLYSLYNYWYSYTEEIILKEKKIVENFVRVSREIKKIIKKNIYTTNFDTFLDKWLNPQHLHGKFITPYKSFNDIILFQFNNGKEFEYKYLFGTNGLEKMKRLFDIKEKKIENNFYHVDFFFGDLKKFHLGHLLIYGLAFGKSGYLTDDFLKLHPEHKDQYLLASVDGHILLRLETLYENKMIDKITVSYYSEEDLINYKKVFSQTKLSKIVYYKHCNEIFKI